VVQELKQDLELASLVTNVELDVLDPHLNHDRVEWQQLTVSGERTVDGEPAQHLVVSEHKHEAVLVMPVMNVELDVLDLLPRHDRVEQQLFTASSLDLEHGVRARPRVESVARHELGLASTLTHVVMHV